MTVTVSVPHCISLIDLKQANNTLQPGVHPGAIKVEGLHLKLEFSTILLLIPVPQQMHFLFYYNNKDKGLLFLTIKMLMQHKS